MCVLYVCVCVYVFVSVHVGQRTASGVIPQSPFTFCLRQDLSLTWRAIFANRLAAGQEVLHSETNSMWTPLSTAFHGYLASYREDFI